MSTEVRETDLTRHKEDSKADKQHIWQLSQPLTSGASILDLKVGLVMCVRPSKLEIRLQGEGQIPFDFPVRMDCTNINVGLWILM